MPELPEVEAARRAVQDNCIGKKIKRSVVADDPKVVDGVSPSDFQASLIGKTIVAAHRKGKNMWLELDSPPFPSFQFGMAGAIYIKGVAVAKYKRSAVNDMDEWPSKYSKFLVEVAWGWIVAVYLSFGFPISYFDGYLFPGLPFGKFSNTASRLDDGLELSFTDKRRFAKVRLLQNPATVPPISELGPDALSEPMTTDQFIDSLSKKKIGIKALLLDQSFISGIGNWIADEVLYQARIHPLQSAASLSKETCVELHKCIKEVIEKAVEVGAESSEFPSNWIFHSREKKPGKAFVDGKKIEFIAAGGRTSAFVPELQKLSGSQATKAAPKPRKQSGKASKDVESDDDAAGGSSVSEEEESVKKVNTKGGKRTKGESKPRPASKRKSNGKVKDDDDEDDDNESDHSEDDEADKKKKKKGNSSGKGKAKATIGSRKKK